MLSPPHLDRDSAVCIAGHTGLVGSALWRTFTIAGFTNLIGVSSRELDLRDREATLHFFDAHRPDIVIDAAARVGGILANDSQPAEFLSDNLRIQTNVLDAAHRSDVTRLLFLGSSCIYPKSAEQPIRESSLFTGPLEPTNEAYAIAKIAGIVQVRSYRRQYGRRWISAMPTNLYGPCDNFDLQTSHVLPALIRKCHEAVRRGDKQVVIWGSGTPRREFLHVDDLASACLFLLEHYDAPEPINVGAGRDISIRDLTDLVAGIVGFTGEIALDTNKPDGTPRKVLDISRLAALGWQPRIDLREGIRSTYAWFAREGERLT
jgi:GDP-L-fucose synthase